MEPRGTQARGHRNSRGNSRRRPSLAANRAFAPMLGAWGAALAGLSVLVLPSSSTARIALIGGLAGLGDAAHAAIAGLAALVAGTLAFAAAHALSRSARQKQAAPLTARRRAGSRPLPEPIKPAEELGSPSLDAPIQHMPLGIRPEDWDGGESTDDKGGDGVDGSDGVGSEDAKAEEAEAEPGPERNSEPVELDLDAFAGLPGRNAVWVEGPLGEDHRPEETARDDAACEKVAPGGDPSEDDLSEDGPSEEGRSDPDAAPHCPVEGSPRPAEGPPAEGTAHPAATAVLRGRPTEELSLVQMVERFAAALHEKQAADQARRRDGLPLGDGRDAALAEALAALSALTGAMPDAQGATGGIAETRATGDEAGNREAELRDALARLRDMRGAA